MKRIVIALGGNAIKQGSQKGSAEEQLENLKRSCSHIVKVIKRGFHVVITHGNGPQVGDLLIQQQETTGKVSPQPLYVCDAIQYLKRRQIPLFEVGGLDPHLENLAKKVDVLYVTQIPVGSFGDRLDDYEKCKKNFVIDKNVLKNMKGNSILMHPLPRGGEINPEVDRDLRAVYLQTGPLWNLHPNGSALFGVGKNALNLLDFIDHFI